MDPWSSFATVICVQVLVLLVLAYQKRGLRTITPRIVAECALAGVVFGILFDLVVGKYLGMFDYALRFTPGFLLVNGALSYGLWLLTVQMLRAERLLRFCAHAVLVGLAYEVANYFFPVWRWTFAGSFWYQEAVVILAAYCGLALITALAASVILRHRYRVLTSI